MAEEIIVRKIEVDTSDAVDSMDALDQSTEAATQSTEKMESQLDALPGPLGQVQQGLKGVLKGFKALLANPIVLLLAAIVAGLAALFKAFTKTQAGADKMKDVMSGLSAIIDVLTERAAKLFKALGQIFRGNFKEGFQQMGDAVKGMGDEIQEATKAAIEYEKAVRAVFEAQTDLITQDAERRKQIAELRLQSKDRTLDINIRIAALERANAIEKEGLEAQVDLQRQKLELIQTDIANTPETLRTREQSRELAEAEVALLDLQTASLEKQKGLLEEVSTLKAEEKAKVDAAIAAETAAALEVEKLALEKRKMESDARKEQAELDAQFEADMAADNLAFEEELAASIKAIDDAATARAIANIKKKLDAEEKAAAEKIKIEQDIENVKRQIYNDSLTALIGFLGEGSKVAKGIQIADATKSAIQGAIATFSSVSTIPVVGPFLAPIAAGAALAVGMANVKKIASVSSPVGGGGGSVPSVSLARPSSSIDSRNLVNADQNIPSQVEISQSSAQQDPVKTYVVQSDVSAAQDIEKQREREATL